jgi:hypothetical protein
VISYALVTRFSPDGIHWSKPMLPLVNMLDRTTVVYNPFRRVWVCSIRNNTAPGGRGRDYREGSDVLTPWDTVPVVSRTNADPLDPPIPIRNYGQSTPNCTTSTAPPMRVSSWDNSALGKANAASLRGSIPNERRFCWALAPTASIGTGGVPRN